MQATLRCRAASAAVNAVRPPLSAARAFHACSRSSLSSPVTSLGHRSTLTRSPLSLSLSPLLCNFVRFATKKAGGSVKNSPGTAGKHLGLKVGGGEPVKPGRILVRQRGTQTHPGLNVLMGTDHTLMATRPGTVHFTYILRTERRRKRWRKFINIVDSERGQTVESVNKHFEGLSEDYQTVLRIKRAGVRLPTSRSLYESSRDAANHKAAAARLQTSAATASEATL